MITDDLKKLFASDGSAIGNYLYNHDVRGLYGIGKSKFDFTPEQLDLLKDYNFNNPELKKYLFPDSELNEVDKYFHDEFNNKDFLEYFVNTHQDTPVRQYLQELFNMYKNSDKLYDVLKDYYTKTIIGNKLGFEASLHRAIKEFYEIGKQKKKLQDAYDFNNVDDSDYAEYFDKRQQQEDFAEKYPFQLDETRPRKLTFQTLDDKLKFQSGVHNGIKYGSPDSLYENAFRDITKKYAIHRQEDQLDKREQKTLKDFALKVNEGGEYREAFVKYWKSLDPEVRNTINTAIQRSGVDKHDVLSRVRIMAEYLMKGAGKSAFIKFMDGISGTDVNNNLLAERFNK